MDHMFCYQCEQSSQGTGCRIVSVCGKDPETAALQDLLVHATKGISQYAHQLARHNVLSTKANHFVLKALFTTVTNVNFDADSVANIAREAAALRDELVSQYLQTVSPNAALLKGPAAWEPAADFNGLIAQGRAVGLLTRRADQGDDAVGLQELLTYGLKGMAAYAEHARVLGKEDADVYAYLHEALDALAHPSTSADTLLSLTLRCGEKNLRVMELLDSAHTERFGHPVPTPVRIHPKAGKAILVSGHDLYDLEALLQQTAGKGINVYTHGEMLPAHGYPKLKKYPHLVGNYGGAWQDQQEEFAAFPGAILMTTNCIQKPVTSYIKRIFTSGVVAWPGVAHCPDQKYGPVIEAALAAPGFAKDETDETILVGFGHNTVLSVAPQVIEGVKSGAIRHFFLVGGCDGAKSGRNYFTDFAEQAPQDCMILTLGCGKYRFNKLDLGQNAGLPRLLDMGQCNDAYSAIRVAGALAQAFGTDVNGLPLSLVLSWFEQKAVAVLLTLLHLGVRDIRIGPSLPAFVTPTLLNVLVEKFGIKPIGATASDDIQAILGEDITVPA
jgi:hydroxylamine reductase